MVSSFRNSNLDALHNDETLYFRGKINDIDAGDTDIDLNANGGNGSSPVTG